MVKKASDIQNYVISFVKDNFPYKRVVCLLAYGSSLNEQNSEPEDYDFLLLLKSYDQSDYKILKNAAMDYPIELFIDYQDQIVRKGFDSYQRGRHGTYFFVCLSTAKCLIGENFYDQNVRKISLRSVERDLLYRIEEYFYRIQKIYIHGDNIDESIRITKKYFSRICMDLLLYTQEMPFSEVHTIHYMDVIDKRVPSSDLFSEELKALLKNLSSQNTDSILAIIGSLYEVYLGCFKEYKNKYL